MKQILIGRKKDLLFSLNLAFWSAMLLTFSVSISFAANGDILYQNCTSGGSCTGAGSNDGWTRTVVSSGCYSGSCLKLDGTLNPNNGGYGAGSTSISTRKIEGKREITVSQWVKFSKLPTGGNIKSSRPHAEGPKMWGADITPHPSGDYYIDRIYGKVRPASWFIMTTNNQNSAYPYDNGDGTYTTVEGQLGGYIKGNFGSSAPTHTGTTWVHYTKWIKLPSTPTARDGAIKIWLGNELMLDIYNAGMKDIPSKTSFSYITFYPSSEAREPFEHWMDDMVIYEGYVPPSGGVAPSPTINTPLTPKGFQAD